MYSLRHKQTSFLLQGKVTIVCEILSLLYFKPFHQLQKMCRYDMYWYARLHF